MNKYLIKSALCKIFFVLLTVSACFFALYEISYREVTINCDFNESSLPCFVSETEEILERAGIETTKDDIVERTDNEKSVFIKVSKAHDVTIVDDGESKTLFVAGTVGDALKKAKIKLRENDIISAPGSTPITSELKVVIERAFEVLIKADGKKIFSDVTEGTVESLLIENGISLGENDKINYPLSKKLKKGMRIIVKRIEYKTVSKTKSIPFKSVTEYSDELYNDESVISQTGVNGVKRIYYLKKYVDGKLKKKLVVARVTEQRAIDEITVKGTKIRVTPLEPGKSTISELTPPFEIELDQNGRPVNYKELIIGEATAYASGTVCSTGVDAMPGRVAVDPREIPYGTKMYIVSTDGKYVYGYSVAADTGGFIYNSDTVVDLRFNTESACEQFGRRNVEIYILE